MWGFKPLLALIFLLRLTKKLHVQILSKYMLTNCEHTFCQSLKMYNSSTYKNT